MTIVANVKLAVIACILQPRAVLGLEYAMRVTAPGARLVPLHVAAGGLGEPGSGRALQRRVHDSIPNGANECEPSGIPNLAYFFRAMTKVSLSSGVRNQKSRVSSSIVDC